MSGEHRDCSICGTRYYRYPNQVRRGIKRFCSRACKGQWQSRGNWQNCATCGKSFWARKSQSKQGYAKYCSKPCWAEAKTKRQTFNCICCGAEMVRVEWQIKKGYTRFCSQDCLRYSQRRLNTHGGGRANLFTKWQKREWMGGRCARCGSTYDLQLDHITPRFAGGETTRENAQTLCRKCNRDKYWQEDFPYYAQLYESLHGRG